MHLQAGEITVSLDKIHLALDTELPNQTKSLSENAVNLERVAQYCEDIYVNSRDSDKQHLLAETKGYTAQALASVAYQIHVLANSFLQLFDNQSAVIDDMSRSLGHLDHEIKIYKEKIARREIGILTTNKCVIRTAKVKRPEVEEKPVKYVRKPIDYSLLDDVGHGVKLARHTASNIDQLSKIGVPAPTRQNSTTTSNSIKVSDPTSTPPLSMKSGGNLMNLNLGNGMGTIRANALGTGTCRVPAVAPPSVPSEYLSRQELGIYSSKKELNQSVGGVSNSGPVGDDSMIGAYGSINPYRRPSQNSATIKENLGNMTMLNTSEYADTLSRGAINNYLHQMNNYPPMMMMSGGIQQQQVAPPSVGYASGKDIGQVRTKIENIDYAMGNNGAGGTMFIRRPQLHPSVYEANFQAQQQQPMMQQMPPPPPPMPMLTGDLTYSGSGIYGGRSILDNNSSNVLPPPPPTMMTANSMYAPQAVQDDEIGDEDELDDDIIPNWVPIDKCLEKVVTIFDYEGSREDELSFKENMHIYVIKKNDDHWYEGIMKSQHGQIVQGLYPYNYARCVKRYAVSTGPDCRTTQC